MRFLPFYVQSLLLLWCMGCRNSGITQLTFGVGNDMEAVWTHDGKGILFQSDRYGNLDILRVDPKSGQLDEVVVGVGNACYPTSLPDGGVVYSLGNQSGTAAQSEGEVGAGYGLRLLRNESVVTLSQGHWRDYTPSANSDGTTLYYASTQGVAQHEWGVWKERVALRKMELKGDFKSQEILSFTSDTYGAVQPKPSPDGRSLVWAGMEGFRSNWRLYAALVADPKRYMALTPTEMSAYAPCWSPDGSIIAFTGFKMGDPAWGIYLLNPRTGGMVRLETGKANSRSPAWSPDGRTLVFENNQSGLYKLYSLKLNTQLLSWQESSLEFAPLEEARTEAWLVKGDESSVLETSAGVLVPGVSNGSALTFKSPPGLDFGSGSFFVRMTLTLNAVEKGIQIAAVGNYAEHPLGWQVIVRDSGKLGFCPRDASGHFMEVLTVAPLPIGKPVDILGIRGADGEVALYLDGVLQGNRAGAGLVYGAAKLVCLGQQWSGGMKLNGKVHSFACGRGWPPEVAPPMTLAELFGGDQL